MLDYYYLPILELPITIYLVTYLPIFELPMFSICLFDWHKVTNYLCLILLLFINILQMFKKNVYFKRNG